MKRSLIITALLAAFALNHSPYVTAKETKAEKCLNTRAKIEKINKKMKQKYTYKQGVKYHKKLEKLYKDEFKYCF
ncbi:hypothetical protein C942_00836 [Photobacterium marinum]|uniref:Uncharacterized protein n=1 Tax=Photobacterium marinum TaxID=1056511 RepID=L8JA82_9GAMM|nr:hypothetical protein [Photobacterium marinum]ELR65750.1 hypothetical protein C942_00836 [Photobacterium marinum]